MSEPKWQQVEASNIEASNIEAIGYDAEDRELHVLFTTGAVYIYKNVQAEVHQDLMVAESKDKFLNQIIKGVYEYEKV